ncbi:hypothetical protein OO012_18675 [Rhodobacteraceae bacterium KMM 6894]|nr:hypothetical protein [Rhodobacteraceae bacterium KMM 6894]
MVEDTLKGAKSTRYRHAARHLAECQASEPAITDYGAVLTHEGFVAALRQKHCRKYGFMPEKIEYCELAKGSDLSAVLAHVDEHMKRGVEEIIKSVDFQQAAPKAKKK